MPNRKTGKKNKAKSLGDVTLNDFANSSVMKNRTKKSNAITVLKEIEEEKSWEEKVFDDGEFVEQENEDGTVSYIISKLDTRRRKKSQSPSNDEKFVGGNEYPIDIWFILSEYIRPEDIGRFAGICKRTYEVVSSAKFWFSVYRRYYKSVKSMPEQLQPECLVRKYNLRASVVRALYYMYTPFVDRLQNTVFDEHPDKVSRRECILMWYEKKKKYWFYYFKMKEKQLTSFSRQAYNNSQPDLLEILDDVFANQDENCQVMQITCTHFVPIPPVLGLTLTSVLLTLSSGFIHHKLQLGFDSGIQTFKRSTDGGNCVSVILDPVINLKVLDWWHPLYPHTHNMEHLLNQE